MKDFLAVSGGRLAWRFFLKVQLHRKLADHAIKGRDARLIFSNDASLGFLVIQFASVELCQTKLDEVC